MSYAEDILKLRQRVMDAVAKGLVKEDGKDFFEATLIQIMNDAERNRQTCIVNAENLRKQAATFEGQAGAFASVSSIVYSVINSYILLAEKEEAEKAALAEEEFRSISSDPGIVIAVSSEADQAALAGKLDKKTSKKKS